MVITVRMIKVNLKSVVVLGRKLKSGGKNTKPGIIT
jgi:hypothetical protein